MQQYPSDIAFTPAVKGIQTAKGSRASYAKVERRGWPTHVTPDLAAFLSVLDMFYLGTASAEGQPYIQYRGGSPGFLKVLDDRRLGFADFGDNRQYITLGNLSENPKAFLFLMDYANQQQAKRVPLLTPQGRSDDGTCHAAFDTQRRPSYRPNCFHHQDTAQASDIGLPSPSLIE